MPRKSIVKKTGTSKVFIQTLRKPWTLSPRMKQSSEQTLQAFARKPRVLNPRLFIVAVLMALPFLIMGLWARQLITKQLLSKQLTLVRASAANLESFFQVYGDSVAVLAQLGSIKQRDLQTMLVMDAFVEQWQGSGLVGGIALTDSRGVVEFNSNVLGIPETGTSLADRDYFIWGKNQKTTKSYFIGESVISRFGATEGEVIVPVASAVFNNGAFGGVAVVSVKLKPLTERFLGLMKVSDMTKVYLVNEQGMLLYSKSTPEMVGSNIGVLGSDFIKVFGTSSEGTMQTGRQLVAYKPVKLGSRNWYLIMATPNQSVLDLSTPVNIKQTAVLLFLLFSSLLIGIMIARSRLY